MEKHKDIIREILRYFDFVKVHKTMIALDWKWYIHDSENEYYSPTINEIYQEAEKRLENVVEMGQKSPSKEYHTSSAGFKVSYKDYQDGTDPYISLSFEIESWDNAE